MGWLEKIGAGIVARLIEKLVSWLKDYAMKVIRLKKEKSENKEAVDKVREAETPEDFDEAARAISDRLDD